jgi:signal peptidase II
LTLVLLISFVVVVLDQLIKFFIYSHLRPLDNSLYLIKGFLDLTYVENRGAAFGFFQNGRYFFIFFTIILLVLLFISLKKMFLTSKTLSISVALIIGGGIGNLIDRIFRGFVIDYIHLSFFYPVCNLADYCICIGVLVFCVNFILYDNNSRRRII